MTTLRRRWAGRALAAALALTAGIGIGYGISDLSTNAPTAAAHDTVAAQADSGALRATVTVESHQIPEWVPDGSQALLSGLSAHTVEQVWILDTRPGPTPQTVTVDVAATDSTAQDQLVDYARSGSRNPLTVQLTAVPDSAEG